jgi:hypothetical protein
MQEAFTKCHGVIRFTEHDGLSQMVLEALSRGKQVLYRNPFDHCIHTPDEITLSREIARLQDLFNEKNDLINNEGAEFMKRTFNSELITRKLVNSFRKICNEK